MKIYGIKFNNLLMQILLLSSVLSLCKGDESSNFVHNSFNFTQMSGDNITIPCILNTSEDIECHWLLNTKLKFPLENKYTFNRVPKNGDCSIAINNLNMKEDDGLWQCQVYLRHILIAPAVRVTILMPPDRPKILYQNRIPENGRIVVEANKTTQIECVSTNGNPVPSLYWILNGRSVEENKSFSNISTGYAKTTLTYVFDKTMNRNRLVCDSRHQLLNENESVELDVVYRPEVRIDSEIITVEEGSDLRNVFCNVESNPPANIKWFDTLNPKITFSEESELRLVNINKEANNKVFVCIAENEIGRSNQDSFKLNVLYEPRIISESINQNVRLGSRLSLNCYVDGNPTPIINWYQLNSLSGEIRKVQTESTDPSILLIKNVTYGHEGDYYCEGSNKINDVPKIVRGRDINVQVHGLPSLLKEKHVEDGNLDSISEIDLEFCANPQPDLVYWKAGDCRMILDLSGENGQLDKGPENSCQRYTLPQLRRLLNQAPKDNNEQSLSNCYKTKLQISETRKEDEKDYILVVKNKEGTFEHSIRLNVISPLSLFTLIILVLIICVLLIAIGCIVIVVLRRKHKGSGSMNGEVLKEEAQTISHKTDLENGTSKTDFNQLNLNTSNDSYELVYANLDFNQPREAQQTEQLFQPNQMSLNIQQQQQQLLQQNKPIPQMKRVPPKILPKPQLRPQHAPRQTNGSTEYAKLTFNKADL